MGGRGGGLWTAIAVSACNGATAINGRDYSTAYHVANVVLDERRSLLLGLSSIYCIFLSSLLFFLSFLQVASALGILGPCAGNKTTFFVPRLFSTDHLFSCTFFSYYTFFSSTFFSYTLFSYTLFSYTLFSYTLFSYAFFSYIFFSYTSLSQSFGEL